MRTTTIAALAAACTLPLSALAVAPAHAEPSTGALKKVQVKKVCRDDGKTRVRLIATVTGDPLIDYTWQIDDRDPHVGDVWMTGQDNHYTLLAFTVPAGSRATVSVSDGDGGGLDATIKARRC